MATTFPDHAGFSFSFSHARITLNDVQFTAISNVSASQELEEGLVRGASAKVLARTLGQLGMGEANIKFSDMKSAMEFYAGLGDRPLAKIWNMDYVLVNEQGDTQSIECIACRLLAFKVDHGEGVDALPIEFPVSFITMKVNGKELI